MATLDVLKSNLNVAKTLIIEGRDRYLGVTKAAISIEHIYRHHRQKVRSMSAEDAAVALSDTHKIAAQRICEVCKENGAIWVKFGQFLSCRPDILPYEYLLELQKLQNGATHALFEIVYPVICANWGAHWDTKFSSFNIIPSATASVAQVHRATLKDGSTVAVKLQIPEVAGLFEQDSLVFKSLSGVISPLVKGIDIKQIVDQIVEMTLEELDFTNEAKNLRLFSALKHIDGIKTPALIDELCTSQILVTEWVEGKTLTDYIDNNPDRADAILTKLLSSYIQQITQFGIYHADPHPGNFIVDDAENITFIDYGAIATLTKEESLNYGQLLLGLMGLFPCDLGALFSKAGFSSDRQQVLSEISDDFLSDDRESLNVSDRLADVMDKLRTNRVTMPNSFVAMARVLISVGGFMRQYDVDFNWAPGSQ